jgi:WD40 repeat protein
MLADRCRSGASETPPNPPASSHASAAGVRPADRRPTWSSPGALRVCRTARPSVSPKGELLNQFRRKKLPEFRAGHSEDSTRGQGRATRRIPGAGRAKRRQDAVQRVAFTPDGRTLIAAGASSAYRWEVGTGKELGHFVFDPAPLGPLAVVLSADGQTLAVSNGRRPGEIAVWNTKEGKEVQRWQTERHASINWLALSPDGRTLASVSWASSNAFALWDTSTGKELAGADYEWYYHALFSADCRTLVCTHAMSNVITLLDVPSGKERQGPAGHRETLKGVVPVGRTMALTWTRAHADVWLWECLGRAAPSPSP